MPWNCYGTQEARGIRPWNDGGDKLEVYSCRCWSTTCLKTESGTQGCLFYAAAIPFPSLMGLTRCKAHMGNQSVPSKVRGSFPQEPR